MFRKLLLILSAVILLSAGVLAQDKPASDKKEMSASTSDSSTKPAAFRPSKDQIRKGQEILIKQKLWDGEATGIYGECRPAIKAYQNRGPNLRHGIALDKQVTIILSQTESDKPLCGIYFNLSSPYHKKNGAKAAGKMD